MNCKENIEVAQTLLLQYLLKSIEKHTYVFFQFKQIQFFSFSGYFFNVNFLLKKGYLLKYHFLGFSQVATKYLFWLMR